eukprot:m.97644 g.97644  ORF g.97644 m.97644 type:complete len:126 (+) comp36946_c0_seq5:28-405(+)
MGDPDLWRAFRELWTKDPGPKKYGIIWHLFNASVCLLPAGLTWWKLSRVRKVKEKIRQDVSAKQADKALKESEFKKCAKETVTHLNDRLKVLETQVTGLQEEFSRTRSADKGKNENLLKENKDEL